MFTSDLFSKKIRFYVSKSEYYDTITTDNSYLKAIADDLNITRKEDRETDSKILFNNKLKLNCKYRDIVDTLGTPAYETIKNLTQQHSVLFYKKKIGGYKIRLEIHVIKNVFLVGFITFNLTSKARKKDLINLVTNNTLMKMLMLN
ncbi:MAG: hypothetical protein JKY48_11105 [Flavobacteriales bacterium]|nr:hypothetical protein [Flavobacteriales bacterium]